MPLLTCVGLWLLLLPAAAAACCLLQLAGTSQLMTLPQQKLEKTWTPSLFSGLGQPQTP
jgi:hypothetical protein